MDLYNLITCRHSARKFNANKVQIQDIQKIIDAGLSAPSGQNSQPWHFTIIQNEQIKYQLVENCKTSFLNSNEDWRQNWAKMEGFDPFYGAGTIIVVSCSNQVKCSDLDCCFALQNMTLMAEFLGLSSCIIKDICWAIDKNNQSQFGIPSDYSCLMSLVVGFVDKKNTNRKTFDYSKVTYLK